MKLFLITLCFITLENVVNSELSSYLQNFCFDKFDGDYRNPEDCSTFIMCSNQITYEMHCVAGHHFNPSSDRCENPLNFDCTLNPCEYRPNGNYKDPKNPEKFITCVWGLAYSMSCYENLFYNEESDQCVRAREN